MHLRLHSPWGAENLVFSWPLVQQKPQDIKSTIKWVLEDLSELKLQEYETNESLWCLCTRFNKLIDENPQKQIKKIASKGLLSHILEQTYTISVKNPRILNKCNGFSPETYGEVSYELMSDILSRINVTPDDVFIDLGSGVGHLVLQLSGLSKCKNNYGIEKEKNRQIYADLMSENFQKWMKFYGKSYKPYQLIKGDFLSPKNRSLIENSSIIFVNNLSFGPLIDYKLQEIFLGLRTGTKIISSKNLCPINMRINERNFKDLGAITHVFEMNDLKGSVSWTNRQIPFYLHVIDHKKLEYYNITKQTKHLDFTQLIRTKNLGLDLQELILKNRNLHEQAKLLQLEIIDLENQYLVINQNRFIECVAQLFIQPKNN